MTGNVSVAAFSSVPGDTVTFDQTFCARRRDFSISIQYFQAEASMSPPYLGFQQGLSQPIVMTSKRQGKMITCAHGNDASRRHSESGQGGRRWLIQSRHTAPNTLAVFLARST
jgi:hypothetical protein